MTVPRWSTRPSGGDGRRRSDEISCIVLPAFHGCARKLGGVEFNAYYQNVGRISLCKIDQRQKAKTKFELAA